MARSIGILAVVAVIGFFIMAVGFHLIQGVIKLPIGGLGVIILTFVLRGCMM